MRLLFWAGLLLTFASADNVIVVRDSEHAIVSTHAPVLAWSSMIPAAGGEGSGDRGGASSGVFALRVNVTAVVGDVHWSTGEVFQQQLDTWAGVAVYEGSSLQAGHGYTWWVS